MRVQEITAASNTVEMENVVISDPTTAGRMAAVTVGNALTVDASATTQPISGAISFTAPQQTIVDSGTITTLSAVTGDVEVVQDTAADLNATIIFAAPQHTIVDSGSITANAGTNLNTSALALDASVTNPQVAGGGTVAPTKVDMVGGKTNDGTPQYNILPLGTGGRSVIVEGVASGTAVPISGAVSFTAPQHTIVDSGTITTVSTVSAVTGDVEVIQDTAADLNATIVFAAPQHAIIDSGTITTVSTVSAVTGDVEVVQDTAADFLCTATLNAETTKVIGTVRNIGNAGAAFDAATAATAPANAIQQGVLGKTALPTAVSDGQLVAPMSDKYGRQVVALNTVRDLIGHQSVQTTDTSAHDLVTAGATGIFNDLIFLSITNETATATVVSLSDGTTTYKFAIPSSGGGPINFGGILTAASTATAWTVTSSATVTLDFVAIFAKNK
jgi:hypothetical protein